MLDIHNIDCMEYMARLEDNAFELAIVDPPYRSIGDNQPTKDMRSNGGMDNFGDKPDEGYFKELCRVSINQIIWGANNFQLPPFKGFVIWKKKTIGESFTMSMCEMAALSEDLGTVAKWLEIAPQDPFRIHPTQKPVKLYEWLLQNYAKEDDRILDTHLGSGSSAIAAHYGGFDFVGCELNTDYFNAAKNRIECETAQKAMF